MALTVGHTEDHYPCRLQSARHVHVGTTFLNPCKRAADCDFRRGPRQTVCVETARWGPHTGAHSTKQERTFHSHLGLSYRWFGNCNGIIMPRPNRSMVCVTISLFPQNPKIPSVLWNPSGDIMINSLNLRTLISQILSLVPQMVPLTCVHTYMDNNSAQGWSNCGWGSARSISAVFPIIQELELVTR